MSESKSSVVLITGCSTGLGLSLAVMLAKDGHKVYGTMRDVSKATALQAAAEAAGTIVTVLALDITSQESTDACIASLLEKEGRIDVLVNNAGAALFRATEQATMAEAQQCFETNFFGALRVTKAVIPHMRKAKSGRILNVSSIGGLIGQPLNDIYCAAKFAVDGWSEALAATLVEFGIHVSVINPGGILTPFTQNAMKIIGGNIPNDEYKPFVDRYLAGFAARNRTQGTAQTAEQVALVIKSAIDAEKPHFRYLTSDWTKQFTHWKTHDDVDGDILIKTTREATIAPLEKPSS